MFNENRCFRNKSTITIPIWWKTAYKEQGLKRALAFLFSSPIHSAHHTLPIFIKSDFTTSQIFQFQLFYSHDVVCMGTSTQRVHTAGAQEQTFSQELASVGAVTKMVSALPKIPCEDATVVCEFGLGCHGCARLNAACLEVRSCTLANGFDRAVLVGPMFKGFRPFLIEL